jgi:hypothetical protein
MNLPIICPARWYCGLTSITGITRNVPYAGLFPPSEAMPAALPDTSARWRYWVEGLEDYTSRYLQSDGYCVIFTVVSSDEEHHIDCYGRQWEDYDGWRPERHCRQGDRLPADYEIIAVTDAPIPERIARHSGDVTIWPQVDCVFSYRIEGDLPPRSRYGGPMPEKPNMDLARLGKLTRRPFVPEIAYHPDPARCVVNYPLP